MKPLAWEHVDPDDARRRYRRAKRALVQAGAVQLGEPERRAVMHLMTDAHRKVHVHVLKRVVAGGLGMDAVSAEVKMGAVLQVEWWVHGWVGQALYLVREVGLDVRPMTSAPGDLFGHVLTNPERCTAFAAVYAIGGEAALRAALYTVAWEVLCDAP